MFSIEYIPVIFLKMPEIAQIMILIRVLLSKQGKIVRFRLYLRHFRFIISCSHDRCRYFRPFVSNR